MRAKLYNESKESLERAAKNLQMVKAAKICITANPFKSYYPECWNKGTKFSIEKMDKKTWKIIYDKKQHIFEI